MALAGEGLSYTFLLQNGIAVLILIAIGMFIWKKAWPFLALQIEESRNENRRIINEFLTALERRDSQFDKVVHELNRLAHLIEKQQHK